MAILKDNARRSVAGKFHIRGGSAVFGTAMMVNLYESVQSDQLRTDKHLYVGLGLSATGTVTIGADTALSRTAANILALASGDSFVVPGSATVAGALNAQTSVILGAQDIESAKIVIDRGGTISFGTTPAAIVQLYRSATDTLSLGTGDGLTVPGAFVASTSSTLGAQDIVSAKVVVDRGGTITFGTANTVNLYYGANNLLNETGNFTASGTITATAGITTKEATGAVAVTALVNNGDLVVQVCGGTARLAFRASGTTYYIDKIG